MRIVSYYTKDTPYDVVKANQCKYYVNCKLDFPNSFFKERKKHGCTKEAGKTCKFSKEWNE